MWCIRCQTLGVKYQVLGVRCHILIRQAATATYFSLANYTNLQCRIGQLVQIFLDIDVGKPDLFESWGWEFFKSDPTSDPIVLQLYPNKKGGMLGWRDVYILLLSRYKKQNPNLYHYFNWCSSRFYIIKAHKLPQSLFDEITIILFILTIKKK